MARKVVVIRVTDYRKEFLQSKIQEVLDTHFPLENLLKADEKVLLKPNLLIPAQPHEAITTHPVFIEAIGTIFKERGFSVSIADNPAAVDTAQRLSTVYKECLIEEVAYRNHFKLLYPDRTCIIDHIPFSWWIKDFKIINLPKLKTHSITVLTSATKNLYGCISGAHKSYLHREHPKTEGFIEVLLKLYTTIKPALHIVDGILSLEGDGPTKKGRPKRTGFIAVGDDALCVDYVISSLLNLPLTSNPLIKKAQAKGLLDVANIEIISEVGEKECAGFKFPGSFIPNYIPNVFIKPLRFLFKLHAKIDTIKCTGCGDCIKVCPHQAITKCRGKAKIDYSRCIMCLCCNEVCRSGAVDIKRNLLMRLLG